MINNIEHLNTTVLLSTNPSKKNKNSSVGKTEFSSVLNEVSNSSSNSNTLATPNELEDIFVRASEKYNISVALLKAVAKAESDFNPNCVSSSGAMGIMQLMPETAKELGVTNAFDSEQNIMGGAKYLAENLEIFKGDISLALAAYNAGRGSVKKYGGIPPYTETQNYVKKVMQYMKSDIVVSNTSMNTSNTTKGNDTTANKTAAAFQSTKEQALATKSELAAEDTALRNTERSSIASEALQQLMAAGEAYTRYIDLNSLAFAKEEIV